jgi:hypothetical protein
VDSSRPTDDSYEDDPYVAPSGPTDYRSVPRYRQNDFCSGVVLAHVVVMFLGGCVPFLGLLGIFTTIGVIAVCVIVLSGPVYYNKHKKDGTLKTWGVGNKVAAVFLLLLFVGGYAGIVYWLYTKGKFG